jgi:hypothetical protein
MKMKALLLALAVSAFVMIPYGTSYAGENYENPDPGTFRTAAIQGPPGIGAMSNYMIGFLDSSGKTPCRVESIRAENPEQALELAKAGCSTCQVRDLTGKRVAAGAPWNTVVPMSQAFCRMDIPANPAQQ